jgi:uncharacterized membrane protein YhaH (DUF805 family)
MSLPSLLFSFQGRIGRLAHLGGNLIVWLVLGGALLAMWSFVIARLLEEGGAAEDITGLAVLGLVAALASLVLGVWATLALAAKRLQDMDLSAWHLLWMVALGSVPANVQGGALSPALDWSLQAVGFLAWAWVFVLPGTTGPNRFGLAPGAPPPRVGSRIPLR